MYLSICIDLSIYLRTDIDIDIDIDMGIPDAPPNDVRRRGGRATAGACTCAQRPHRARRRSYVSSYMYPSIDLSIYLQPDIDRYRYGYT